MIKHGKQKYETMNKAKVYAHVPKHLKPYPLVLSCNKKIRSIKSIIKFQQGIRPKNNNI